jgi:hypothetical protein
MPESAVVVLVSPQDYAHFPGCPHKGADPDLSMWGKISELGAWDRLRDGREMTAVFTGWTERRHGGDASTAVVYDRQLRGGGLLHRTEHDHRASTRETERRLAERPRNVPSSSTASAKSTLAIDRLFAGNFGFFFVVVAAIFGILFVVGGPMAYSSHKKRSTTRQG